MKAQMSGMAWAALAIVLWRRPLKITSVLDFETKKELIS